jgi:hypothetical protein
MQVETLRTWGTLRFQKNYITNRPFDIWDFSWTPELMLGNLAVIASSILIEILRNNVLRFIFLLISKF